MSSIPSVVPPTANAYTQDRRGGALLGANFRNALDALRANQTRAFLTMLGVIIGVAAVIASATLTLGVATSVNQRFTSLGTNSLLIFPGPANTSGAFNALGSAESLTLSDAQAVQKVAHLVNVSPLLAVQGQVVYSNRNWNTQIQGVYPNFQSIKNWQLAAGHWYGTAAEAAGLPQAVIGQTIVDNLFAPTGTDPIGKTIRIKNQLFQVVGVLQAKGGQNDDVIYVPFTAALNRLKNSTFVDAIQAEVDDVNNVAQAQQDVTTLLQKLHHIQGGVNDFRVLSSNQIIQAAQQNIAVLTALFVGIAAISLTVGGIGIMNIMLVSVTERTREIGLRMAIGARQSDIRNQFLIEALTLSAMGGAIGIVIGLLIGWALTSGLQLPFTPDSTSLILAFGVSAIVGVLFGLYPAVRASRLDPIVALRTE